MTNYNFGDLLEKARLDNAIKAAKQVSEYCKSVSECANGCVFFSQITGECIFTRHNRYGFHITPEDWEV